MKGVRLSIGTAIAAGLREGILPDPPTTAYVMVGNECINNCAFCSQARGSEGEKDRLSRVIWPHFELQEVLAAPLSERFQRICLQCLMDPAYISLVLPDLIEELSSASGLPISVSISPVSSDNLSELKGRGAERVGIALDCASRELFPGIKGRGVGNPYTFDGCWEALDRAVRVFGKGRVSTHLIAGLGETDRELIEALAKCVEMGVLPSLFSYTPLKGTALGGSSPPLPRYRAMQVSRHLIVEGGWGSGDFQFDGSGRLIGMDEGGIPSGIPGKVFMTIGCPDCNRPYYNERPGGPIFNYPRPLTEDERSQAVEEAKRYVRTR